MRAPAGPAAAERYLCAKEMKTFSAPVRQVSDQNFVSVALSSFFCPLALVAVQVLWVLSCFSSVD